MAIKTFTTGEVLTAADTNTYLANSGLVYISTTTIGSGVTSATVSNCFSSTYDDYRVIIKNLNSSASDAIAVQIGTISGASYLGNWNYILFNSTTPTYNAQSATTNAIVSLTDSSGPYTSSICDITNPNLALFKFITGMYQGRGYSGSYSAQVHSATAQTSLKLLSLAGTITGGTITVYGYRKA